MSICMIRGMSVESCSQGVEMSFVCSTRRCVRRASRSSGARSAICTRCPCESVPTRYSFSPCASMQSVNEIGIGRRNSPARSPYRSMVSLESAGNSVGQINIDNFDLIESHAAAMNLPVHYSGNGDGADYDDGKGEPRQLPWHVQPRQQQIIARADEQQIDNRQNRNGCEVDERHAG